MEMFRIGDYVEIVEDDIGINMGTKGYIVFSSTNGCIVNFVDNNIDENICRSKYRKERNLLYYYLVDNNQIKLIKGVNENV